MATLAWCRRGVWRGFLVVLLPRSAGGFLARLGRVHAAADAIPTRPSSARASQETRAAEASSGEVPCGKAHCGETQGREARTRASAPRHP